MILDRMESDGWLGRIRHLTVILVGFGIVAFLRLEEGSDDPWLGFAVMAVLFSETLFSLLWYHQRRRIQFVDMPDVSRRAVWAMVRERKDLGAVAALSVVVSVLGVLLLYALYVGYPIDYLLVDSVTFSLLALMFVLIVIRVVRDWPERFDYLR